MVIVVRLDVFSRGRVLLFFGIVIRGVKGACVCKDKEERVSVSWEVIRGAALAGLPRVQMRMGKGGRRRGMWASGDAGDSLMSVAMSKFMSR